MPNTNSAKHLVEKHSSDTIFVNELAVILGLSKKAVQNKIYKGDNMPPSVPVGGRHRIWLKSTVLNWLKSLEEDTTYYYK